MTPALRVFDSWALIAWLRDEAAAERVDALLADAEAGRTHLLMSWINVGEVFYMLVRKHGKGEAESFLKRLPALPIRLSLADDEDVIAAARLKSTRRISYADAFAVRLAQKQNALLVTGDPELRILKEVKIEWLGARK